MPGPYANILETVGRTPIVRINKLAPPGVNLFVKVEAFNPMGSVKDRLALGVIEAAERDGSLKPGQTVIEATSGNTGIGLAMVCAQKGYPLVVTMAENFSVERRKLMRFLGAQVVLTPASEKGSGLPQQRDADGAPSASHPNFRPHLMQGWTPDFIPKLAEDTVLAELIDETVPINGQDALRVAKELARKEGIFTGISGGATLAGALEVAKRAPEGANIVGMLPDTGERYPAFLTKETSAKVLAGVADW